MAGKGQGGITPRDIQDEIRESYMTYAMSVIVSRALPDVRDGLKPVHRRILYAMHEAGNSSSKPYSKSARTVGYVMGNYHPHGDAAIYETLVRMAQDFSMRYLLIDGQGNFGSVDGDNAAAMRYTEARLATLSEALLSDIDKDTVDWRPNFDERQQEPVVLPSALPQLLMNGSTGIAVGMATNIPPHNLGELRGALKYLKDNPNCKVKDLRKFVKGPDFPTGGIIVGTENLDKAYEEGKGIITVRARSGIETSRSGKESIVVTELPYAVNKSELISKIALLSKEKRIDGIFDIRDESGREGIRLIIEIKRDASPLVIQNQLYKYTSLQTSFGIHLLALDKGKPILFNLKVMLERFLEHRIEVITRRSEFDLAKAEERDHIVQGLLKALDKIDAIIKVIRAAKDAKSANQSLRTKFKFSERQATAILEMRLAKLTGLERHKLEDEHKSLLKLIKILETLLGSKKKIKDKVIEELDEVAKRYSDDRLTEIQKSGPEEVTEEDLIQDEEVAVTISHLGYIKRMPVVSYRLQKRGGKGVTGADLHTDDFVEHIFTASTHDYLVLFSNRGKAFWIKVHSLPSLGRTARGKSIKNFIHLSAGEEVNTYLTVPEFREGDLAMLVTRGGVVKKMSMKDLANAKARGILGMSLSKGDELVEVVQVQDNESVIILSKKGQALRMKTKLVRRMGRGARGVKGLRLVGDDGVVGMVNGSQKGSIMMVTEGGYGKKVLMDHFQTKGRGGKGIIYIKTDGKSRDVAAAVGIYDKEGEVMIITSRGILIKLKAKEIPSLGRSARGVRLVNVKKPDFVVDVARSMDE